MRWSDRRRARARRARVAVAAAFILAAAPAAAGEVVASYYWHGARTANGERFDPLGLTAAHRSLPFGTRLRVTWRGRAVIVRINDRGPFVAGRDLDLSLGAARALGMTQAGLARVRMEILP